MNNPDFGDLKGKVCVITGGTGGIGSSLARALAQKGVKPAILSRSQEKAGQLATDLMSEYNTKAGGYAADILDKTSLEDVKKEINNDLGPVNFLINCAGGNSPKATTQAECMDKKSLNELQETFYGLDIEGFEYAFDLNIKGTILPSMVFTKDMLTPAGGSVINISSMSAFNPLTKIPAYSAAKAAVNNFTQWFAVHLAQTGIRVNAIAPGFFLTDQNRFLLIDEKSGEPTERGQKIINNTPMRRLGQVEELQGTVLFLLSDLSEFITGVCIPVDGGFSAYSGV